MRVIKKFVGFVQIHFATTFSVLLFASFVMVGVAFNIAMSAYISAGAADALQEARTRYLEDSRRAAYMLQTRETGVIMRVLRGSHRFAHTNVRIFVTDYEFNLPDREPMESEELIATQLAGYYMFATTAMRLRAAENHYYISILPVNDGAVIFYLDVSDTFMFIAVVNRLLIASVAMIWLISMAIAGVLASSMVKPLHILSDFVRQIGRGDFTPNSYKFTNEEFEELNQSLNHTANQLANYDNEQKIFFQNVSHELRTPLMAIKSYAEGIKYGVMEPSEATETILRATNRLSAMVDDILYVSRIDFVKPPQMAQVNLCSLVRERIKQFEPLAKGKAIKADYSPEEIMVTCAATYIERAVDNLLSNALRFAESEITVVCATAAANAVITVMDDGKGFTEGTEHVFERFYRGKNGLTGIGLATVKSITDLHKGSATAENGVEKGAVLTITIPRRKGLT